MKKETNDITRTQAELTARLVHGFDFIMDVNETKVEKKYTVIQDVEKVEEQPTPIATEKLNERHSTIVDKQDGHDFLLGKLGLSKPTEKVREVVNVHAPEVNEPEVEATYRPGEFFPVKV